MSFSQGVSGLNAAAANLDVIGNNIANSGTAGYKSGSVQFSNVYAGSMAGLGTKVAGIFQDFTAGAIQRSNRPLDVAIVDGNGFFRMTNTSGEVRYTRNGQFNVDKDQFIVNAAGMQLTGFPSGAKGSLAALKVDPTYLNPAATTLVDAQFNIDARSGVPATTPFMPDDSNTYNYSNSMTIHDSTGATHELSVFFVKNAVPGVWDVYASADGVPLASSGAMLALNPATTPPSYPPAEVVSSLKFDTGGKLMPPDATTTPATTDTLTFSGLNFGTNTADLSFDMTLAGSTQFAADHEVRKMSPDGNSSGQLTTIDIGADGVLTGKYSNQQTMVLGEVVLSSFDNVNGLRNMGDNVWAESPASGQPKTDKPGMGKSMGSLLGGAVEGSNVDLTAELINLIIAQRTYQANTQTVKTQDQVVQALMNLR
jgi:flagellar hook protein FlgE